MNTFAHQIDAQWEREEPLGVDFVRGLLGQVWDADREAIDSAASRGLVEALDDNLWLLDPDGLPPAISFICAYWADNPTYRGNPFTTLFEYRDFWDDPFDYAFVEELLAHVWDPTRRELNRDAATLLARALEPNLDRLEPDARALATDFYATHWTPPTPAEPPARSISATPAEPPARSAIVAVSTGERQCPACAGSGQTACGSCGGMGGRYQSRIEYDYDSTPIYRDEWVGCFCDGGSVACGVCNGSGTVFR
ncbi:zinc finger-like domain-containing protein [Haloplanus rubicundus]|uniref:Uncharacterized protein n=1 Tax=Haloplanus rubicundus TaxID=1547898 RepID=A0A345E961_9EURY|nr:zinc finger-like domain-containing protein [Haloplanus rubicundus]AXG08733.1 hypothetical protein DU484_02020 [Haloplanus rubicundus]